MLIRRSRDIPSSQITSERVWLNRRAFIDRALKAAVAGATVGLPACGDSSEPKARPGRSLAYQKATPTEVAEGFYTDETIAPYRDITHYNNFYEFGTDKGDPARYAADFRTEPWSVVVDGEVDKPGKRGFEDILAAHPLEERIYRLRCVEAWSMVVPWIGFPLASLLRRHRPTSRAKYVAFTTLYDPSRMPAQRSRTSLVDWPYVEGLRIDEAMHPLTLLAVGLYGKTLPGQNGAPIRLVVPWKYGFKSIKSIVRISLVEQQPPTTWSAIAPDEYGFYANVNPHVDHPRWSQAYERRLPSTLFSPNRIKTRLFNGYADEVAQLYAGMDLKTHF